MLNWKMILFWFVLMGWRLGSAAILVLQGQEKDLIHQNNIAFWALYALLWLHCLSPQSPQHKDEGGGDVLYSFAWAFFIGLTGLAIKFLAWSLLRILWDIEVGVFWGEVFTVIFATTCLYISFWLRRNAVKTQEFL